MNLRFVFESNRKTCFFSLSHFHSESTVEQNVSVVLNGVESELKFVIGQKGTKVKFYHQKKRKIHEIK